MGRSDEKRARDIALIKKLDKGENNKRNKMREAVDNITNCLILKSSLSQRERIFINAIINDLYKRNNNAIKFLKKTTNVSKKDINKCIDILKGEDNE